MPSIVPARFSMRPFTREQPPWHRSASISRTAAEREALRLAVVDARARAEAAAAGAGLAVDRVLRIDDTAQVRVTPPRPLMAMAREAADVSQTPIEAGELEIRAHVVLTVTIR